LFKQFSSRTPEEVIYHFLSLPFNKITNLNVFGGRKPSKAVSLTIDQREAINTMISQDTSAIDDYNNPIVQHAAAFKIFLDKIKHDQSHTMDTEAFKNERDAEVDTVLGQISDATNEHKDTILELEQCLKDNSQTLKAKAEAKIKTLVKVMIELQLGKIEQKVGFLDEYEKFMFHELRLLELSRSQLKVERIKQEREIKGI
jgi:SWIRM-associated region 1